MKKSCPDKGTNFLSEDQEIVAHLSGAIIQFPVKAIALQADATEISVKNWRDQRNAPGFAKAMKLGRRVPAIKDAIIEILGGTDHQRNRLIAVLLKHLAEIARGSDEASASQACKALREFGEMCE